MHAVTGLFPGIEGNLIIPAHCPQQIPPGRQQAATSPTSHQSMRVRQAAGNGRLPPYQSYWGAGVLMHR
jgi:hypothetical protein